MVSTGTTARENVRRQTARIGIATEEHPVFLPTSKKFNSGSHAGTRSAGKEK